MTERSPFDPHHSALFTDLYELTMFQAYHAQQMFDEAVFELFFRKMPKERNYVVAAGLDNVLTYLENLRFEDHDIAWLKTLGQFSDPFLESLHDFRFEGHVNAVPEGTVVFENEPVLQVIAPLPQAQLVETYVLNQIHLQSVEASKAGRVITAAEGRTVVDFGSRRSHGTDAALKVARTSYLMGAAGTSNLAAGRVFDIPVFGTMAHSYIEAHDDETSAFKAFAREFPQTTLLVDTYDTLEGVRRVTELMNSLGDDFQIRAIRLDSGDLLALSKEARRLLDEAGLNAVNIFASSGLNEHKVAKLLASGAPIDGFGVGTDLAVSADVPEIDFAYKLVSYAHQPRMKLSSRKATLPGLKQVFRVSENGEMVRDVIAGADESLEGSPLLQPVMHHGRRLEAGCVSLTEAREHASAQLRALPTSLKLLSPPDSPYAVEVSAALQQRTAEVKKYLQKKTGP
jgi:nicotinate phosphoribosyltransferase